MPFDLITEIASEKLVVTLTGTIDSFSEYMVKSRAVIARALETGLYRVLSDERGLRLNLDWFALQRVVETLHQENVQTMGGRMACLYPREQADMYRALETLYMNRSFSWRLFEDASSATAWLML